MKIIDMRVGSLPIDGCSDSDHLLLLGLIENPYDV